MTSPSPDEDNTTSPITDDMTSPSPEEDNTTSPSTEDDMTSPITEEDNTTSPSTEEDMTSPITEDEGFTPVSNEMYEDENFEANGIGEYGVNYTPISEIPGMLKHYPIKI